MRAAAYIRVSTVEQSEGLSLPAQRERIAAEVGRRGWTLAEIASDNASGKNLKRPGLRMLLEDMRAGRYDVLIVTRLDRLSRSAGDFFLLMDQAKKEGWRILCMDPNVDMTDPFGEAMAGMAAVFAQLERRLISQRQKESVAARKAAGTYRPAGSAERKVSPRAENRVRVLHSRGMGRHAIADRLTLEGLPSPNGGPWSPNTVRNIIHRSR